MTYLSVIPRQSADRIALLAGKGSDLHRKHHVYIDRVGFANYPCDYQKRLVRVFPLWSNVRLWALEPHDLALTKLDRSNDRDIRDVIFLTQAELMDRGVLIARFETELEPYLVGPTPTWHRTTLDMWIDACWPAS